MPSRVDLSSFGIQSTWLKSTPQEQKTLLAVFAHPDDESFGPGGVLAKYSAQGAGVHYACGTRGEAGTLDNPDMLQGFASLGELRWHELECAMGFLGLTGLHYLGYRDSGMPGSLDNDHPESLVQAERATLVGKLVALIRSLRPQVVVTFDPHGGYGHPDHIAIHHAATEAFYAAGDAERYPEQISQGIKAYAPQKLYYTTFPKGLLKTAVFVLRMLGRDPTKFGRNQDINLAEIVLWDYPVTTRVDIGPYLERKEQAAACHRSQAGPAGMFSWLPLPLRRRLLGSETFTLIHPPADGHTQEKDLFE